jgi:hypothetical protein
MFVVVMAVAGGFSSEAFAQQNWFYAARVTYVRQDTTTLQEDKVRAPAPVLVAQRREVASGARVTLFANFLRQESGVVVLEIGGTSWECELIEWQPNSVTVDLPRLGLAEPKDAEITIVLPDGRIAKKFSVKYVRQPDIVLHDESIPRAAPPLAANAGPANYVVAVEGGFRLCAH